MRKEESFRNNWRWMKNASLQNACKSQTVRVQNCKWMMNQPPIWLQPIDCSSGPAAQLRLYLLLSTDRAQYDRPPVCCTSILKYKYFYCQTNMKWTIRAMRTTDAVNKLRNNYNCHQEHNYRSRTKVATRHMQNYPTYCHAMQASSDLEKIHFLQKS